MNLAIVAKAESVTFAANKDDTVEFPDCRPAFVEAYNRTLIAADLPVQVVAPYIDKSKAWIAARGQDIGVRMDETWSCYQSGPKACGKCLACLKREAALATV